MARKTYRIQGATGRFRVVVEGCSDDGTLDDPRETFATVYQQRRKLGRFLTCPPMVDVALGTFKGIDAAIAAVDAAESTMKPYSYTEARELLCTILSDLSILAGDKSGPSDASWQDVAGTAAVNLHVLSRRLEAAREGRVINGPVVFPSPAECMEG